MPMRTSISRALHGFAVAVVAVLFSGGLPAHGASLSHLVPALVETESPAVTDSASPHRRPRLVWVDGDAIKDYGRRARSLPLRRAIVLGVAERNRALTALRESFAPKFPAIAKDSTLVLVSDGRKMVLAVRSNDAHADPTAFCAALREGSDQKPCDYIFYRRSLETALSWTDPTQRIRVAAEEPRRDAYSRPPPRREWEAVPGDSRRGDSITISIADRRLFYRGANGEVMEFPVAVGRSKHLIILGDTVVVRKRPNPTWRPTPTMRAADPNLPEAVGPGPSNPLGRFALDLAWPYIRIHGTNDPSSVGHASSSGCYRMLPEDIERLFSKAGIGTRVRVVPHALKPDQLADAREGSRPTP